jgi:hypothetical protein
MFYCNCTHYYLGQGFYPGNAYHNGNSGIFLVHVEVKLLNKLQNFLFKFLNFQPGGLKRYQSSGTFKTFQ